MNYKFFLFFFIFTHILSCSNTYSQNISFIEKYSFSSNKGVNSNIKIEDNQDTTLSISIPFIGRSISAFFNCFVYDVKPGWSKRVLIMRFSDLRAKAYEQKIYIDKHESSSTLYMMPQVTFEYNMLDYKIEPDLLLATISNELFCMFLNNKQNDWFLIKIFRIGTIKFLSSCEKLNSSILKRQKWWVIISQREVNDFKYYFFEKYSN